MLQVLSQAAEIKIKDLVDLYPDRRASLLPILSIVHEEFGHLSDEALEFVAARLGLKPAFVRGVATFYSMYATEPRGRFHLQVCTSLSCALNGAEHLCRHLESRLGIQLGETTPDKQFTLSEVECLAACDTAPAMQVNKDTYGNLTPERLDELLDGLRKSG